MTASIGLACFFFLVDTPSLSSWLKPEEIRYLQLRQASSRTPEHETKRFDRQAAIAAVADWKIYFLILASWSSTVPNYAMKFTMPAIIKSMGFTSAKAQLLTIPPYVCGAVSTIALSRFADRTAWRMPFIVGPQCCVIVAFAILFSKAADIQHNVVLCYFAVCLACFGWVFRPKPLRLLHG